MGAVTGGARREGIGVVVELGRSESSFLAGDRSGDQAQNGVEVLASAEVTRQSPPVQGADAVLDTDVLRGMGLAFGLVGSGDGGQDGQLAGPTRKPGLVRVSSRCVLAVAATSRSTSQRTTWRPRGASERGEELQQPGTATRSGRGDCPDFS